MKPIRTGPSYLIVDTDINEVVKDGILTFEDAVNVATKRLEDYSDTTSTQMLIVRVQAYVSWGAKTTKLEEFD